MSITPVRLGLPDIQRASLLFSRAFHYDPLSAYLLPNPAQRERLSPRGFQCILRYGVRYGEMYATSSAMEGVAVWLPPQPSHASLLRMASAGGVLLPFTVGPRYLVRFLRYFQRLGQLHEQHTQFPHWYLQLLGVTPEHQHRGHASALLTPMLGRFDQEKMPCCLDTLNGDNVPFYERFGFRVVAESKVPKTNIGLWLMVRKAGAV